MTDIRKGFMVKTLLTAGAVSLLLAGQAAIAQDSTATSETADQQAGAEAEFTRDPSQLDVNNWQKEFSEVDENSNNDLEWEELESAYEEQLSEANWDREQVINEYDKSGDGAIDEAEYFLMLGSLQAEQSEYTAQQGQESQDQQQQEQTASTEGQQSTYGQSEESAQQRDSEQGVAATGDSRNAMGHSEEQQGEQLGQQQQDQEQQSEELAAEELQGRSIVNLEGEEVGQVEDVVRSQQGSQASIVVSTGGFLGMGGQEVLINTDELRIEQDQVVWQSSEGKDALQELPEYNEDDYVSVR